MASNIELVGAYLFWRGSNKFYCKGKVMMGPDNHRTLLTFMLMNVPSVVFYAVTVVYLVQNPSYVVIVPLALLSQISCNYFFLRAAFTNPGYIPQQEPPLALGPMNSLPYS